MAPTNKVIISASMNETDVREAILRPLLNRLGYEFGQTANIRTEVSLRYSYAYLGRKKPGKDPELRGRADYVCEVIPYGRWVVEAKPPSQPLTIDDSYQAHTYSTHPEVAAWFYLLSNGHSFQVFQVGNPDKPVMTWSYEETDERFLEIKNLLSPQAIQAKHIQYKHQPGKPLAEGMGPQAKIAAGFVTPREARSNNPQVAKELVKLTGVVGPVTGENIFRKDNGLIGVNLNTPGAFSIMDSLNKSIGADRMIFETADEYISTNPEIPSIFQGIQNTVIPTGTTVPGLMGQKSMTLPFTMRTVCFVEAIAHIQGNRVQGTYTAGYNFKIEDSLHGHLQQIARVFDNMDAQILGDFNLVLES